MAGYKCLSYGCRADNDAAMHKLFVDLQTTVNRFASAVKIEPIKVDGIIGKGTTEATLIVLLYIAETDKGVVGSSAAGWEAGIASPDQLAANARGVLDTLILATRQSAVAATTTPPAAPPAGTGTKPGPSVTEVATTTANAPSKPTDQAAKQKLETVRQKKPVLAASLLDRVPPWASYVGGAVLILGAIGLVMRRRGGGSSRASAPASAPASTAPTVAGRWY